MRALAGFAALLLSSMVVLSALMASAQAQSRLPRQNAAEREVEEINRALQRQQRQLGAQQQNQFEINQLRQELNRQRTFPSMTGPGTGRVCAPGEINC